MAGVDCEQVERQFRRTCTALAKHLGDTSSNASAERSKALHGLQRALCACSPPSSSAPASFVAPAGPLSELLDVVLVPLQRLVEPPEWWLMPVISASHGTSADDNTTAATDTPEASAPGSADAPRSPSARARAAWASECELALQCVSLCMDLRAAATAASASAPTLRTELMVEWMQRCLLLLPLPQRDGAVDERSFAATASGEELRAEALRCLHAIFKASVPHAFCHKFRGDARSESDVGSDVGAGVGAEGVDHARARILGPVVSEKVDIDDVSTWLAVQRDATRADGASTASSTDEEHQPHIHVRGSCACWDLGRATMRLLLGHCVSVLLGMCSHERNRAIKADALATLRGACEVCVLPVRVWAAVAQAQRTVAGVAATRQQHVLQRQASERLDTLACFAPGMCSALIQVAMYDTAGVRQGGRLTGAAIGTLAWTVQQLMCDIALQLESVPDSVPPTMNVPIACRDAQWLSQASERLWPTVTHAVTKLRVHPNAQARLEVVRAAGALLSTCGCSLMQQEPTSSGISCAAGSNGPAASGVCTDDDAKRDDTCSATAESNSGGRKGYVLSLCEVLVSLLDDEVHDVAQAARAALRSLASPRHTQSDQDTGGDGTPDKAAVVDAPSVTRKDAACALRATVRGARMSESGAPSSSETATAQSSSRSDETVSNSNSAVWSFLLHKFEPRLQSGLRNLPRIAAAGNDAETAAAANVCAGLAHLLSMQSDSTSQSVHARHEHKARARMEAMGNCLTMGAVLSLARVSEMNVHDVQLNMAVSYATGIARPAQSVVVGWLPLQQDSHGQDTASRSRWCNGHVREPFVHLRAGVAVRAVRRLVRNLTRCCGLYPIARECMSSLGMELDTLATFSSESSTKPSETHRRCSRAPSVAFVLHESLAAAAGSVLDLRIGRHPDSGETTDGKRNACAAKSVVVQQLVSAADMILTMIFDSAWWKAPVVASSDGDEQRLAIDLSTLRTNALTMSLLLQCVGTIAMAFAPPAAHSPDSISTQLPIELERECAVVLRSTLMRCLFPLLEKLSSESNIVSSSALRALESLAWSCGHRDSYSLTKHKRRNSVAGQLLTANVDYLLDALALRLTNLDEFPSAPSALAALIAHGGVTSVPLLREAVDATISALDEAQAQEVRQFQMQIQFRTRPVATRMLQDASNRRSNSHFAALLQILSEVARSLLVQQSHSSDMDESDDWFSGWRDTNQMATIEQKQTDAVSPDQKMDQSATNVGVKLVSELTGLAMWTERHLVENGRCAKSSRGATARGEVAAYFADHHRRKEDNKVDAAQNSVEAAEDGHNDTAAPTDLDEDTDVPLSAQVAQCNVTAMTSKVQQQLLVRVAERASYFFAQFDPGAGSPALALRLQRLALGTAGTALAALSKLEQQARKSAQDDAKDGDPVAGAETNNRFLPLVHRLWAPFCTCFERCVRWQRSVRNVSLRSDEIEDMSADGASAALSDNSLCSVLEQALQLLQQFARLAGRFVAARFARQLWPLLLQVFMWRRDRIPRPLECRCGCCLVNKTPISRSQLKLSRKKGVGICPASTAVGINSDTRQAPVDKPRVPPAPQLFVLSGGSANRTVISRFCAVQIALCNTIAILCRCADLMPPAAVGEAAAATRLFLRYDMPDQLRDAATKMHRALAQLSPDIIWLQSIAMLPEQDRAQWCRSHAERSMLPSWSAQCVPASMKIGACVAGAAGKQSAFQDAATSLLQFMRIADL